VTPLHDPEQVRVEYADDVGLTARASVYRWADGPDVHGRLLAAIASGAPQSFLDVGCGRGELLERVHDALGARVVGLDQSEHMVELARARGCEAVVGDAQALPFADGSFDCVSAAWMLYHVPDVDRALAEFARVLRPGGRFVAVTNAVDHMVELYDLLGASRPETTFSDQNGEALVRRYFAEVELIELGGWVTFPTQADAQGYVDATPSMRTTLQTLPERQGPLRVRYSPILFVATK
jgi:SAM-dependent methyltransferase